MNYLPMAPLDVFQHDIVWQRMFYQVCMGVSVPKHILIGNRCWECGKESELPHCLECLKKTGSPEGESA